MSRETSKSAIQLTILVDIMSMLFAFYITSLIRGGILVHGRMSNDYGNALVLLILSSIIVNCFQQNQKIIFKRGYFEELLSVMKDQGKLCLILFGYMFLLQKGLVYSRIFFSIFFLLNILVTYVCRCYMKVIMLLVYKKSDSSNKMMVITLSKNAAKTIRHFRKEYEWKTCITSLAILDEDMVGEQIEGVEVVANRESLLDIVRVSVVDEVFIQLPYDEQYEIKELILELEKMGINVHMNIDIINNINLKNKTVQDYAGYQVITFRTTLYDGSQVLMKRLLDILGGIVGCILTVVITIILAPLIMIESPGPIFFSQIRIGKNGRKFKIYKFRSMYADAEERKKELMDKNEMQGLMFKMTDDPRITKIGKFIRKTSLDEFPQFLNVLKGDMSLVGTRPPTEDEFLQYETRHKRRLMLKPGITGLWQVSGRSDIDDFEEVVRLDLEYIDNWSLKLDIKLLLKTVAVVVLGRGSK